VATDMPGEQTIMPWKRVKFDEMGQNKRTPTRCWPANISAASSSPSSRRKPPSPKPSGR